MNFKVLINKTFHLKARRSTTHLSNKIEKKIKKWNVMSYMENELEFNKNFTMIDKRISKEVRKIDGKMMDEED